MESEADKTSVLVIPCSGIGKVQGLIGREATYIVTDELASGETDTLCLALLVKGDPDAVVKVQTHECITIDGCGKACAEKNVQMAGGCVSKAVQVAAVLKNYRGTQPGTGAILTVDGWPVAREIAETVAGDVACLHAGEEVAP
jgi:uncharacterized metal-binding protein